jgi:hypothetical protein
VLGGVRWTPFDRFSSSARVLVAAVALAASSSAHMSSQAPSSYGRQHIMVRPLPTHVESVSDPPGLNLKVAMSVNSCSGIFTAPSMTHPFCAAHCNI